MLRLSKLETRTQEIVLLLTTMGALALLVGSTFYIYLSPHVITSITGNSGTMALAYLFHNLGYATFLIPFSLWMLGDYTVMHANTLKEILKFTRHILYQAIIQAFIIGVSASFLTIIQIYFRFAVDAGISHGAGGSIGILIGGELFRNFGLFGSATILISLSVMGGILSGQIELVAVLLYIAEVFKYIWKELKLFGKYSWDFILRRMGIFEDALAETALEFESATGQYVSPHEIPNFVHNFTDKHSMDLIPEGSIRPNVIEIKPTRATKAEKESKEDKSETDSEATAAENAAPGKNSKKSAKKEKEASHAKDKNNADDESGADAKESKAETESDPSASEIVVSSYTKRYSKPEYALLKGPAKMHPPSKSEVAKQSRELESRLASFKLGGKVVDVHTGTRLTMYEFLPDAGVKLSRISALSNDLALLLGAESIRVLTPIPGKTTVGVEVPNEKPSALNFSELVKAVEKAEKEKPLPIALGKNVYNDVVIGDISSMPHLLISGTTGSGKSVFMNTLITSLIYTKTPKELRFLMIDPKMIELSPYNGIPHLLSPVVTDVTEAKNVLIWAEQEMDRRYKMFGDTGSRNISSFNEMIGKGSQGGAERKAGRKFEWEWTEMPYIVVVIDELADLMITQGKEVEIPITRIAQKARACGIHMVIATQRPSADIVTGLIKTNFPTRIAFKVSSAVDSRTILDVAGAEKLLGNGDMLYMPNGKAIERIQASFLSEEEVKKIVRSVAG